MKGTFSTIVLAAFGVFALAGLAFFALSGKLKSGGSNVIDVTMWGTVPSEAINAVADEVRKANKNFTLTYTQKDPVTFADDLVEAIASGVGPDLMILPQTLIYRFEDKIYPLPEQMFSPRNMRDIFIQNGEIFLGNNQALALPFAVNPMVMYWNRDILAGEGYSFPPKYWDEMASFAQKVTKQDKSFNIHQSAVSFGEFDNVNHAKDILTILIMQAGGSITTRTQDGLISQLNTSGQDFPAQSTLAFFTQFSNPAQSVYSWNRSEPSSIDAFIGGELALYFGNASEITSIRTRNPNLNFDVAPIPQIRDSSRQQTFGDIYGVAALKTGRNISSSLAAVGLLTQPESLLVWSTQTNLPPVRRDMLAQKPADPYQVIFYNAALISNSWIDPDSKKTDDVFRQMVNSVTSARTSVADAVVSAQSAISDIIFAGARNTDPSNDRIQ